MTLMGVSVAIPTIPPRGELLARAVVSALAQTIPPDTICVALDHERAGAATTRNRALAACSSEWVVFLDDDDELHPTFIEHCLAVARDTGADVVAPWFEVKGGSDPFPANRGIPFDPERPHSFPITTLVRRELAEYVGGFPYVGVGPPGEIAAGEDFRFWTLMGRAGATIVTIPDRLWTWHHRSGNTGGRPDRW